MWYTGFSALKKPKFTKKHEKTRSEKKQFCQPLTEKKNSIEIVLFEKNEKSRKMTKMAFLTILIEKVVAKTRFWGLETIKIIENRQKWQKWPKMTILRSKIIDLGTPKNPKIRILDPKMVKNDHF